MITKKYSSANTFTRIYQIAKRIPAGKVTTYGLIAHRLKIKDSRIVGWALHVNKNLQVPCHRVVNRHGSVAENFGFGGKDLQKKLLLAELIPRKSFNGRIPLTSWSKSF